MRKIKRKANGFNDHDEWIEDTLFCVMLRRRYDKNETDREMLYLFRLLAILFKVTGGLYSMKEKDNFMSNWGKDINEKIKVVLECKIANGVLL